MHSRYSEDGEFDPKELVQKCAQQKIELMSITDHNCTKANITALPAAQEMGIKYISGIEIDCVYETVNFHVLGYGIDCLSEDFAQIEDNLKKQCLSSSRIRLQKTQELGFHVTENDLWNKTKDSYWKESWTGELFAEVLLEKPEYKDSEMLLPYRAGGARSDNPFVNFYWDFYSQGKPCYAPMQFPSMEKIISIIHRNHGIAVLAHPGANLKGKEELLDGILMLGMDGIEAFSSYHTPAQAYSYYQEAKSHGLITTCGSDFHGATKPSIVLGGHGGLASEEEIKEALSGQIM